MGATGWASRHVGGAALIVAAVVLLGACSTGGASGGETSSASAAAAPGTVSIDLDGRPFRLHVPDGYAPGTPVPLLVGLHGYTSNSTELDGYFGLMAAADQRGFLLALPDGLTNPQGEQFWNAVEGACCDFYGADVDDSAYLSHLIETVRSSYAVDRVAMLGHSNGGYMTHRFACDHADQVDAVAALAGPLPARSSLCHPSEPVSVLHIHGTADDTVPYGGSAAQSSASAEETARRWAELDGCDPTPDEPTALDLESTLEGAETTVIRYAEGCRDGSQVELWAIDGGGHVPTWTDAATPAILDFLLG